MEYRLLYCIYILLWPETEIIIHLESNIKLFKKQHWQIFLGFAILNDLMLWTLSSHQNHWDMFLICVPVCLTILCHFWTVQEGLVFGMHFPLMKLFQMTLTFIIMLKIMYNVAVSGIVVTWVWFNFSQIYDFMITRINNQLKCLFWSVWKITWHCGENVVSPKGQEGGNIISCPFRKYLHLPRFFFFHTKAP